MEEEREWANESRAEEWNRLDVDCVWMWGFFTVCLSVWLCVEGWLANSEGKIDSKPDVKWNLSLGHIRCDWGRMCGVCIKKSVPCAQAFVGINVRKDSGGNLEVKWFSFLISLNGCPRRTACSQGWTRVCLSCNFNAFFLPRVRLGLQC